MPKFRFQISDFRCQIRKKLNKTLSSRAGFTLTEILVAITIIMLVAGLTIPNFRRFSEDQELDTKAADLIDVLRQAHSGSNSSIKCNSGLASINWKVRLVLTTGSQSHQIIQTCRSADEIGVSTENKTAQISMGKVSIQSISCLSNSSAEVIFENNQISFLCDGNPYTSSTILAITLNKSGRTKTVTIDKGGAIY